MRTIFRSMVAGLLFAAGAVAAAEPVDINTATAEQLSAAMKDVGKVKAEAIVKDREKNGPFKSVDDLARVKGIKKATVDKNRDRVTVGGAATPAAGTGAPAAPVAPPPAMGTGVPAKPAVPPPPPPR